MHAENAAIDSRRRRHEVKRIHKQLPHLHAALGEASLALVKEAIQLVDGGAFVISAKKEDVVGVLELKTEEVQDGFETEGSSVHIVPIK